MKTPILVATDGTVGSLGAVRLAKGLAEREQRPVEALSVLEPVVLPSVGASYPLVMPAAGMQDDQLARLQQVVTEQVREVAGSAQDWSVEIEVGSPPATIVRRAAEIGAEIIILGLGRHDAADRWLGTETALKVIHLAHVPVLAAHPGAVSVPSRALVGMDFSDYARDAARTVCNLTGDKGEVHLAHVAWGTPSLSQLQAEVEWLKTYRTGALARLEELRRELQSLRPARVLTTLLEGETCRALIKYARMSAVDMIATGSHGYGFFGRMMMGSVSTRLLRQAPCSVLIAPPRSVAVEALQPAASLGQKLRLEPASV